MSSESQVIGLFGFVFIVDAFYKIQAYAIMNVIVMLLLSLYSYSYLLLLPSPFPHQKQMLGCRTRGFSFTRALLGISADELHLCGDPAAVPLIQEMLRVTGDEVEVIIFFM